MMNQIIERLGGVRYKTYRIYEKRCDRTRHGRHGFIGSQITAANWLPRGHGRVLRRATSTIGLAGLPLEHFFGDILDREAVDRAVAGCDLVFHVAALSSYWRAHREDIYRVNVEARAR